MFIVDYIKAKKLDQALKAGKPTAGFSGGKSLGGFATALAKLPTKQVPTPLMRRSYLHEEHGVHIQKGLELLGWLRIFAGASLSLVFIFSGVLVYANSTGPENALYAWKLGAERARLTFASSPAKKAELQLKFVENRLSETTVILADPNFSEEVQARALQALATQTQVAIDSVAGSPGEPAKNIALLAQLSKVTQHQVEVLNQQAQTVSSKPEAQSAMTIAKEGTKTAEIQKLMVAAANDQAFSELGVISEELEGIVQSFEGRYLTLDGMDIKIYVSDKTVVELPATLESLELSSGQKIVVLVDFNSSKTSALAKSIDLVEVGGVKPQVKSADTVLQDSEYVTPGVEQGDSGEEELTDTVSTGFQIEDPALPGSVAE